MAWSWSMATPVPEFLSKHGIKAVRSNLVEGQAVMPPMDLFARLFAEDFLAELDNSKTRGTNATAHTNTRSHQPNHDFGDRTKTTCTEVLPQSKRSAKTES